MSYPYDTYRDIDFPYLASQYKDTNPVFPNFWRSKPLDQDSLIDPRRAGYRPYFQYQTVSRMDEWIDSPCPVIQNECDLILPVNKCYARDPNMWMAEIFRGR